MKHGIVRYICKFCQFFLCTKFSDTLNTHTIVVMLYLLVIVTVCLFACLLLFSCCRTIVVLIENTNVFILVTDVEKTCIVSSHFDQRKIYKITH